MDQLIGQISGKISDLARRVSKLESQEPAKRYGTVFPTSPYTNQRYFRTDRGLEYYYDGTRWLSSQMFTAPLIPRDTSVFTQAAHVWETVIPRYDIGGWYAERLQWYFYPATVAQSGVNFYTISNAIFNTGTAPTLAGTIDTKAMTTLATYSVVTNTFSANQVQATSFLYQIVMAPTLNPGQFVFNATLQYRLIG